MSVNATDRNILGMLAFCQQQRLDTAAMLRALARQTPRRAGVLIQLAAAIHSGLPVVDALEQTPGVLPRSTVLSLRVAREIGTLETTYQKLIGDSLSESSPRRWMGPSPTALLIRATYVGLVAFVIHGFLLLFVWPTLTTLQDQFGELDGDGGLLSQIALWQPLLLLGWLALFAAAWIAWFITLGNESDFRWVHERTTASSPPRHIVLPMIADALAAGRPTESVIATLTHHHPDGETRRRLVETLERMDVGESAWMALAKARFLTLRQAEAIDTCGTLTAQVWLMQRFAQPRRFHRGLPAGVVHGGSLGMLFISAVLVLLPAVAMFWFLSRMIGNLA